MNEHHQTHAQAVAGMTLGSLFRVFRMDPVDLRILLSHALGYSRVRLITESEHVLTDNEADRINALVLRRQAGEPVAYITGVREFFGLAFAVNSSVLIPRPETELLVELAIDRLPQGGSLADLGTGSGAIAVSVAANRPDATVYATDISTDALKVAGQNASVLLKGPDAVRFCQGDWLDALPVGIRFDLLLANPPYIQENDTHLLEGDLRFEPKMALTDFSSGYTALEKIVRDAPRYMKGNGWLFMEHGYDQAFRVRKFLAAAGYRNVTSIRDLAGIERVSGGQCPEG